MAAGNDGVVSGSRFAQLARVMHPEGLSAGVLAASQKEVVGADGNVQRGALEQLANDVVSAKSTNAGTLDAIQDAAQALELQELRAHGMQSSGAASDQVNEDLRKAAVSQLVSFLYLVLTFLLSPCLL